MTPDLIRTFQRTHTNHLGKALALDGDLGPETQWAMDVETLCAPRRRLLSAAQNYLGVREVPAGSNEDPGGHITRWLARCPGARVGDPWCAAVASALLSLVLDDPVNVAGALRLGRRYAATTQPLAGDLFYYPTNDLGAGHVGIVAGVEATQIMTYEGNCAHAFRCARRVRTPLIRYARPIPDDSGTGPGVVPHVPWAPGMTR